MTTGLLVQGLKKKFRGPRRGLRSWWPGQRPMIQALAGVDLMVSGGQLVALLGPNGAGKTTLLKILATLIRADAGTVRVDGVDAVAYPERARARVGYVLTEERSFYWRLSVRDNLRFFAALEGCFGIDATLRITELGHQLAFTSLMDRRFSDLSAGQKQRVAIARGLLSDPPVLLFDEATKSLDPGRASQVRAVLRQVLVEEKQKAVLFATHNLEEARRISDTTVVMQDGRIVAEGPFSGIEHRVQEVFSQEAKAEDGEVMGLLETCGR